MRENKNIILHPDRFETGKKLKEENLFMLAYCIETGLSLAGYDLTQERYNENIDAALSDD